MGCLSGTTLVMLVAFAVGPFTARASDISPVSRVFEVSKVMERVQLVGVIASGSSTAPGIAVIRDSKTGKTFTLKTGDSLPGVAGITLSKVQRELVVFLSNGKEYDVHSSIGVQPKPVSDDDDDDDDYLPEPKRLGTGAGLFERWYGSKVGVGPDLVEPSSSEIPTPVKEPVLPKVRGPLVIDVRDFEDPDDNFEDDREQEAKTTAYIDNILKAKASVEREEALQVIRGEQPE